MRKAWVLMDLRRYDDARRAFEDGVLEACLGQFSLEVLYEYFFSYGNTLGSLGEIDAMDDKLSRAMGIAAEELGDYERLRQCWRNLLQHATAAGAWSYLARECESCVRLAGNRNDEELAELARGTWQRPAGRSGMTCTQQSAAVCSR
jgi:tetratricopeptide (TPR) repeat protein